jgi:hypothetical protein
MPEVRIPKLIMEWIPQARRKRGCPRKTWMNKINGETGRNGVWVPEDGDSC